MHDSSEDFSAEPDDSERRLLEILDRYTDALHEENLTSRSVLLERHPELAALLRCLESLDSLAIPANDDYVGLSASNSPTLIATAETPRPAVTGNVQPSFENQPENGETFGRYQLLREIGRGGMGGRLSRAADRPRPAGCGENDSLQPAGL